MDYKKEWNVAFEKYLRGLDAKKPVIWGGDFNCAPTDKDIRHAKPNWNKTPVRIRAKIPGRIEANELVSCTGLQPS